MTMATKKENQMLVNFKVDESVKNCAELTLLNMGMNLSSYVNLCLRQLCVEKQIPFTPTSNPDFWLIENNIEEIAKWAKKGLIVEIYNLFNKYNQTNNECLEKLNFTYSDKGELIFFLNNLYISMLDTYYDGKKLYTQNSKSWTKNEKEQKVLKQLLIDNVINFANALKNNKDLSEHLMLDKNSTTEDILRKYDSLVLDLIECYDKYQDRLSLWISNTLKMDVWDIIREYSKKYKDSEMFINNKN